MTPIGAQRSVHATTLKLPRAYLELAIEQIDDLPDMARWLLESCSWRLERSAGRAAAPTVVKRAIEGSLDDSMVAEDMSEED